jgi:hypothetical protein
MLQSESGAPGNAPLAPDAARLTLRSEPRIEDVADAVAAQIEGEPGHRNLKAASPFR